MARGDFTVFEEFADQLGEGRHDFDADTIKLGLVDDTLTPLASAAAVWGTYSANEVSTAGGYTSGGETLSGVTWEEADGVATLDDTDNISLSQDGSGFTDAYWGILYNDSDTDGPDAAIGFLELGGPVSEQAGPITITWNASGILTVTVS